MEGRRKWPAVLIVALILVGEIPDATALAQSWRRVTALPAAPVTAIAVLPGADHIAAASGGSVYLSEDGGVSWRREARLAGEIRALAFAGDFPSGPGLLAAGEEGVRWVGGAVGLLPPGGVSRRGPVRAMSASPGAGGAVVFATGDGVVVAAWRDGAWKEIAVALPGRPVEAVAWESGGGILAAGERGLFRFDAARPGSPERLTTRPARDVASSGHASLALTGAGLFVADGGASWRPLEAAGGPSRRAEAVGPLPGRAGAFVVADALGVWRVENGRPPVLIANAPPGDETEAILGLPDGRILGATDRGLFEHRMGKRTIQSGSLREGEELAWHSEPTMAAVRRAVIRASHLEPARIRRNFRGVRTRALLPELALSFRRRRVTAFDQDRDQTFTGGALRRLFDQSLDRDRERDFVVEAEWDLGSLLFNPDELDVSEEARRVLTLRDDVLDEVNQIFFERRRVLLALARLEAGPEQSPGESDELRIKIDELTARLDAWSDGFFSRERARLAAEAETHPPR